ncbi:MAG TPA: amino acid adenylation domain-containing protein [Chitinophagaceae bacterium]|nr:amino acid adenylation domain-containing protein [Chitinophagaceae bacterium]
MDEQSSQLANYLKANNVTDGSLVPVLLNRGLEVIIAIIGIMKAGAAYVPIDPELPFDRIAHILQDIDASIIITGHAEQAILQEGAGHPGKNHYILNIEKQWSEIDKQPATHTTNISQSGLAYVIYTSGSTGKPKGVKIKHRSLVDYVFGLENKITISECKSFALVSTISADLGNTVIFSSLAFGGALHLFTKETISNPWQLTSYFTDNKIDCLKIVPSHWQALCTDEKILLPEKRLIFGGEALPGKIISRIKATGTECTVVNHYGPTETTIGKLLNKIDIHTPCDGVVPLGKPFGNTNIYILNKHKALCATGLAGELYIEGDGVADGYLNRDDLTAERFITNPFNTEGKRLYKTGDLVKYLPDGSVAFLGRVDDQVKIRGYRIELNEIASILEQCPLVKQAAVIAKNTGDTKKIAAYIVPAGVYNKYEITAYLKSRLPAYMIPSLFMQLEKLPLTENGKIDKKNLPEIEEEETYLPDFAAPVTDDEKMISEIWCELLGHEKISINSNFFELGGDSLTAIKLMARLQKKLDINLPLAILFQYSTIKTLAANLRCQDDYIKWECLVPIRPQGNKTPAYIVHGVGGHVLVLNHLLKYISPEQPLYGLQPKGIKGKSEIPRTIEDISAYYIQEILQQNQTGPYIIGGFSFGGIIAFEMAQQLTAMGKEVKMLVMFDTYLGRFYEKASPFTKLGWKLHKIIYTCVLLWQNPKVKIAFEKRKFKDKVLRQYNELRWKLKGNKVKKNHMYYIYKIQDGLKSARRIYKPAPYKGEIHLFRAKKKTFYFHDYTYLGWQPFALNGIKTHDMPGEHEKIFLPPDDTIFGVTLQQCLDECDASFGSK